MNKVLVVEESTMGGEIFSEYMQDKFGIPFPFVRSAEAALEEFVKTRPNILVVEIVLPNSRREKVLQDEIDDRQKEICRAREVLELKHPPGEIAGRLEVMDRIQALNFCNQVDLFNRSGGIDLLKSIKKYCVEENIPMPKVMFYTTQSSYEYLEDLSKLFDNDQDYRWIEKPTCPERVIQVFRQLTGLEVQSV